MYSAIRAAFLGRDKPQSDEAPKAAPSVDDAPARILDRKGRVSVLVGSVGTDGSGSAVIRDGSGAVHAIPPGYEEAIEYLRAPRTVDDVISYARSNGLDIQIFTKLGWAGAILRVNTANPVKAALSFTGVSLVAQSVRGNRAEGAPSLVEVHRVPGGSAEMYVPRQLADVLWGRVGRVDLPTACELIDDGSGLVLTARQVLTNLPAMLKLGLARLEWTAPRT